MDYADLRDGLDRLAYDWLEAHGRDVNDVPEAVGTAIDNLLDALEESVREEE